MTQVNHNSTTNLEAKEVHQQASEIIDQHLFLIMRVVHTLLKE